MESTVSTTITRETKRIKTIATAKLRNIAEIDTTLGNDTFVQALMEWIKQVFTDRSYNNEYISIEEDENGTWIVDAGDTNYKYHILFDGFYLNLVSVEDMYVINIE